MTTPVRLQLKDASATYGVAYGQLWEAVKRDQLPAVKILGRWNVRAADIETWISEHGEPNQAEKDRTTA